MGFQDDYGAFVASINARLGLTIANREVNRTQHRIPMADLTHREITAILNWVEIDMEIYQRALREFRTNAEDK